MILFLREINNLDVELLQKNHLWSFAHYLIDGIEAVTDEKTVIRNHCIKANRNHPIAIAAKNAYWKCYEWVLKVKPEEKYSVLQVAISGGDEEISKATAAKYIECCKAVTRKTADSVTKALIFIRQCAFSGYRPPRENRPNRFIEIFEAAFPRFSAVAPELAEETKRQALYNRAMDR